MKKLIAFIYILSVVIFAQGSWERISSPVASNLNRSIFIDSLNGWVAGDSGKVLRTTNGGINWDVKHLPTNANLNTGDFININSGWVMSWYYNDTSDYGTNIYSTIDGGNSWQLIPLPYKKIYITGLKIIDSLNAFLGGNQGFIARTENGGMTWTKCEVDSFKSVFYVNDFSFYNKNYGFAYGGLVDVGGIIWRTTNGGINWEGDFVATEPIRKLHFYDSLNIFGIGGDAEYGVSKFNSTNGGITWHGENLSYFGVPQNLAYRTKSEAWIPLGFVQYFLVTYDSGKTWQDKPVPDNLIIYDITFPDSLHGFAAGLDGSILKYKYTPTGINDEYSDLSFKVDQNYPNPFNPETIISFSLKVREKVSIKIFNLLGKEITELVNKEYESGSHNIRFNAAGLASGVYFYRVTGETFSVIKKMLLIR